MATNFEMSSAQYSARSLVLELFAAFERRLIQIGAEELDRSLSKIIKRNEDLYMDNLLKSLNNICDVCLPAVLDALIKWYAQQQKISLSDIGEARDRSVKRTLAASYLFCVTLIEILPQIHYHPQDCKEHADFIVNTSFTQVAHQDPSLYVNNYNNSLIVADAFAEVIGVLSETHSRLVQNVFMSRLQGFRREALSSTNANRHIISLLTGIKYFRINTSNIAEFELGVTFLNELGTYYLEIDLKQKELKHRMAFLLVEILSPICGQIKMEANIPSLIAFVEKLYGPTYELINKKQHKTAAYPLLTCLLCISQTKFFIPNWIQFLNLTLANLKNKDPKITRMALESLYRLLWVYIIRNNCEANTTTRSRLESICGSLFPRGNRNVIPRNASTSMLIKIIHVISQQKLDFVFKEIIFDLLGCNRASRSISIYPERMDIGMRALMVIVDGLRQKEGPPEMSRTLPPIASCATQRNKKTYLTSPLTADVAAEIGLEQYYQPCRRAFDGILRALDTQVGRPFLLTNAQIRGKEYEDVITGEIKPKLDLFRTCVASIPRLLPDPMSHQSLIEMLIRLSVHVEEELRSTACTTLQNLITECAEWRADITMSFVRFITNSIPDTYPLLLESVQEFFLQLVVTWKSLLITERSKLSANDEMTNESNIISISSQVKPKSQVQEVLKRRNEPNNNDLLIAYNIHCVEGLAFIMLCQLNTQQRRNAILLLNETRQILSLFESNEAAMITVLEEATPYVVQKYIQHVSLAERQNWPTDFMTICDHICRLEVDSTLINNDIGNEYMRWDPWACALSGYCEHSYLPARCPTAVLYAWPSIFSRMSNCYQYIDPSNPQNESRGSLLRSSKNKLTASTLCKDMLNHESYLSLWQKYVVVCCALVSPNVFLHQASVTAVSISSAAGAGNSTVNGSFSPNGSLEMESSLRQMGGSSMASSSTRTASNFVLMSSAQLTLSSSGSGATSLVGNCANFFQKISNMLRWENMTDMRDSVVLGVGSINPACFEMLLEELHQRGIFREAQDKKVESNVRRRKRKDQLRLQLVRILEFALFRCVEAGILTNPQTGQIVPLVHDFIEFISDNIQYDTDRDVTIMNSLRQHFAKIVKLIINNVALEKRRNLLSPDLRHDLFMLLFSWCARILANDKRKESGASVEYNAVEAMCALSCCGNVFESRRKNDEQYLYRWLEALMSSNNQVAETICEETLCIVLHLNEHMPTLFEHIIQLCYTEVEIVAARCFQALTMLFSSREYPCEFMTLFVLCQMFSQNPNLSIRENSLQLLRILRRSFLDNALSRCVSMYLPSQAPQNFLPSSARKFDAGANGIGEKNVRVLKLAAKSTKRVSKDKTFGFVPIQSNDAMLEQLSLNYSQLTMPIFSEVCSRINDARPNRQTHLLRVLLYWVKNVELSDHNCDIRYPIATSKMQTFLSFSKQDLSENPNSRPSNDNESQLGESVTLTGSEEATQLLLNNMFYLTFTLSESHDAELAALWQNIGTSHINNLPIIVHYLWVMITLSPDVAIPAAKKVLVYLLASCGDILVTILVDQLTNSKEAFLSTLMRSDIAPYYRWTSPPIRMESRLDGSDKKSNERQPSVEKNPMEPSRNEIQLMAEREAEMSWKFHNAKQLPMPPYGGFNAKLSVFLPPVNRPVASFSRENLALCLLCDLIGSDGQIMDWRTHLSPIVHVSVISLDAKSAMIRWSARRALLNTCLISSQMAGVNNMSHISTILLYNYLKSGSGALAQVQSGGMSAALFVDNKGIQRANEANSAETTFDGQPCGANVVGDTSMLSAHSIVANQLTLIDYRQMLLCDDELFQTPDEILSALVYCLSERQQSEDIFELWPYEDVSVKRWKWDSINLLSCFVRHFAEYFLAVDSSFVKDWTAVALNMAFRTTNRHFLGRSLHVASALCQPPNAACISRILSELVDLLDETGEEAQDKIADIILFLINITRFLRVDLSPTVTLMSTVPQKSTSFSTGHYRSISCTTALLQQLTNTAKLADVKSPLKTPPSHRMENKKENRHSLLIQRENVDEESAADEKDGTRQNATLSRSKSVTDLDAVPYGEVIDTSTDTLSHILYIAIAIMDTSSESVYVLSLHLLNQFFVTANAEISRCFCNLKHLSRKFGWMINTTGIIPLICKGVAYSLGAEVTLSLLAKCSKLLHNSMVVGEHSANKLADDIDVDSNVKSTANRSIDECGKQSLAMIIVAVLPHCMKNFRNHKSDHTHIAEVISVQCIRMYNSIQSENQLSENAADHPLHNLAMMMDQYRDRTFQRDCFQWAKCVVKYLIDAFNPNVSNILLYLIEILERNDLQLHVYILNLMNHFVAYGDLLAASPIVINAQIIRNLLKYLQIEQYNREVASLMKSFVDKWNIIEMPTGQEMSRNPNFELYDGQLDLQVNLNKYRHGAIIAGGMDGTLARQNNARKAREKLISLLDISGAHVGLQRSSSISTQSVVNNQADDYPPLNSKIDDEARRSPFGGAESDLDPSTLPPPPLPSQLASQTSIGKRGLIQSQHQHQKPFTSYNSNEDLSGHKTYYESTFGSVAHLTHGSGLIDRVSITTDSVPKIFKEFDFLEAERDSVSESTDSCFNWTSTMRSPRGGGYGEDADENIGDEHEDEDRDDGDGYGEEDGEENDGNKKHMHMPLHFDHYSRRYDRLTANNNHPLIDRDQNYITPDQLSKELHASKSICRQSRGASETAEKSNQNPQHDDSESAQELYSYRTIQEKSNRLSSSSSESSNKTPVQVDDSGSENNNNTPHIACDKLETKPELSCFSCESSDKEFGEEYDNKLFIKSEKNVASVKDNVIQIIDIDDKNCGQTKNDEIDKEDKDNSKEHVQPNFHRTIKRRVRRNRRLIKSIKTKNKSNNSSKLSQNFSNPNRIDQLDESQAETPSQTTTTQAEDETLGSTWSASASQRRTENWIAAKEVAVPRSFGLTVSDSFTNESTALQQQFQPLIECDYHVSGKVELLWKSIVALASNDLSGEIISSSFILFSQILRECSHRLCSFLRDASQMISSADLQKCRMTSSTCSPAGRDKITPGYGGSSSSLIFVSGSSAGDQKQNSESFRILAHAIEVITTIADSPILFLTPRFLQATNSLPQTQFDIYELQEHLDVFFDRREQCIRLLNTIQSAARGPSRNHFVTSANYRIQELELFKCLHKLLFQLFILYKKLYDTAQRIQNTINSKDYDLAPAVTILQQELYYYKAQETARLDKHPSVSYGSVAAYGGGNYSSEVETRQLCDTLLLNIANKQFGTVFNLLYKLRTLCGLKFGCCEQTDVESIVLTFCRGHAEWRAWALIERGGGGGQSAAVIERLAGVCGALCEASATLAAACSRPPAWTPIAETVYPPSLSNLNISTNSIPPTLSCPSRFMAESSSFMISGYSETVDMSVAANSRSLFPLPRPTSTQSSATESARNNADLSNPADTYCPT